MFLEERDKKSYLPNRLIDFCNRARYIKINEVDQRGTVRRVNIYKAEHKLAKD
jgi:hypothetical protein